MDKDLRPGDLVTVKSKYSSTYSNTYKVGYVVGEKVLLYHPMYPDCYIEENLIDLDKEMPRLKSSIEKCIEYAIKNKSFFDYSKNVELDSVRLYLAVNKTLSSKQKSSISEMCAKIATIVFEGEATVAAEFVNKNKGVLDGYNDIYHNHLGGIFSGKKVPTPNQRETIFKVAGFVLAQMEPDVVLLKKDNVK
jgi:hypothetical protein